MHFLNRFNMVSIPYISYQIIHINDQGLVLMVIDITQSLIGTL